MPEFEEVGAGDKVTLQHRSDASYVVTLTVGSVLRNGGGIGLRSPVEATIYADAYWDIINYVKSQPAPGSIIAVSGEVGKVFARHDIHYGWKQIGKEGFLNWADVMELIGNDKYVVLRGGWGA